MQLLNRVDKKRALEPFVPAGIVFLRARAPPEAPMPDFDAHMRAQHVGGAAFEDSCGVCAGPGTGMLDLCGGACA